MLIEHTTQTRSQDEAGEWWENALLIPSSNFQILNLDLLPKTHQRTEEIVLVMRMGTLTIWEVKLARKIAAAVEDILPVLPAPSTTSLTRYPVIVFVGTCLKEVSAEVTTCLCTRKLLQLVQVLLKKQELPSVFFSGGIFNLGSIKGNQTVWSLKWANGTTSKKKTASGNRSLYWNHMEVVLG